MSAEGTPDNERIAFLPLHLQVTDFRAVARDVVLVELAAMDGTELPAFTPARIWSFTWATA